MLSRFFPATLPVIAREMDNIFGDVMRDLPVFQPFDSYGTRVPPLNAWETNEHYLIEMEIPGLSEQDVEVKVLDKKLTIQGSVKAAELPDDVNWQRRERFSGSFSREIAFPLEVDAEHIEATIGDGLLRIRLPKSKAAQPRRIEVAARKALTDSKGAK